MDGETRGISASVGAFWGILVAACLAVLVDGVLGRPVVAGLPAGRVGQALFVVAFGVAAWHYGRLGMRRLAAGFVTLGLAWTAVVFDGIFAPLAGVSLAEVVVAILVVGLWFVLVGLLGDEPLSEPISVDLPDPEPTESVGRPR